MAISELSPSRFRDTATAIEQEIGRAIVGQHQIVQEIVIALVAGGHVLLEGVPGLGKTRLVKTIGDVIQLDMSRIQFTPDLMPSDVTGTTILEESETGQRSFRFQPGPIFANLVLADEINRATPKTQSALLEAMQEGTTTVANERHILPQPFFVLATQNPLEMEGTYPLPEAQLDRFFFKTQVPYPTDEELHQIVVLTATDDSLALEPVTDAATLLEMRRFASQVPAAHSVVDYIVRLVLATRPDHPSPPSVTTKYVRYGASPRAAQTLVAAAKVYAVLQGRMNVAFEDVRAIALPALRHRVILNFEAEANGIAADDVLGEILATVSDTGF